MIADRSFQGRKEDVALLDGSAQFIDDIEPRGTLHAAMLRSSEAHARILSIDTTEALAVPGVRYILTGADLRALTAPTPITWAKVANSRSTGSHAMATTKVRYVGHIVAAVVATSRAIAEDAAQLVEVNYEPLPAVLGLDEALAPDAPRVHEGWPDNVLGEEVRTCGDWATALAEADVIVDEELHVGRDFACPLETRGVVASWEGFANKGDGVGRQRLEVWLSCQSPHRVREVLAEVLGVRLSDVRVRVPHVGGGFGSKANYYGEEIIVSLLSRLVGRPVKYIEDRVESFVATSHARQQRIRVQLAARADGTLLGLKSEVHGYLGGELSNVGMGPVWVATGSTPGPYRIPHIQITATGVMTNRTPYGSYRGWGHPKANFAMERALDALAYRLGISPIEVRLINMRSPEELPGDNGMGWTLDSGDYAAALRQCRRSVADRGWLDWQTTRRNDGSLVGIGYASFIEATGVGNSRKMATGLAMDQGGFDECVIRLDSTGTITVFTGQTDIGQGITTTLAELCADVLGARPADVRVVTGDTDACPYTGYGTGGCRTASVTGSAITIAAKDLRQQLIRLGAARLMVSPADTEIVDSEVRVASDPTRRIGFDELGFAAYRRLDLHPEGVLPVLEARAVWDPVDRTYGYGSVAVMVEIDPDTGIPNARQYLMVDDCGKVVNPVIVDGQIMGGFVQALGGALLSELVYAPDGQPLCTTFKDYLVPTAIDAPRMAVEHRRTDPVWAPSGSKGIGEAGTICAFSAIAQAVEDAVGGERTTWATTLPIRPDRILARLDPRLDRGRG
ncbi:MAG: xanthine dehydrogenase family protein molybdopterin-binding subunit [Acidimicrobiia bacterium]